MIKELYKYLSNRLNYNYIELSYNEDIYSINIKINERYLSYNINILIDNIINEIEILEEDIENHHYHIIYSIDFDLYNYYNNDIDKRLYRNIYNYIDDIISIRYEERNN